MKSTELLARMMRPKRPHVYVPLDMNVRPSMVIKATLKLRALIEADGEAS